MYICSFVIISPWKGAGPFIWTNFNPLHPRIHCAMFGWNWPGRSGEDNFFNFGNVFSLFRNYLPFEKDVALHMVKLESPSPKDALCQLWWKLVQWFWRWKWKCEKLRQQRRRWTTDKAHLSQRMRYMYHIF